MRRAAVQPSSTYQEALRAVPQSLPELAYEYVRDLILSHRVDFGEPLRQEEIAASLGISRLPVREALRRLDVEGLVMLRPRRGYVVASLNRDEIEEVFDIRAVLEYRAGYLATIPRTQNDVEDVGDLLAALDRAVEGTPIDVAEFGRRNSDFHERLFLTSRRPHLCRLLRQLRSNVERYARLGASMTADLGESHAEHHGIYKAFRNGDADSVARLCRLHCENTCRRLLGYLDDEGAT